MFPPPPVPIMYATRSTNGNLPEARRRAHTSPVTIARDKGRTKTKTELIACGLRLLLRIRKVPTDETRQ
jgi:hypothetical protein